MDHEAFAALLGNYGEFVGAIAVVGTLVYLAVQVRHSKDALDANTRELEHNRRLTSAEVFENITERFQATQMQTAQNKEIASIFLTIFDSEEQMPPVHSQWASKMAATHFQAHFAPIPTTRDT